MKSKLNKQEKELVERAVRFYIADLQFERARAEEKGIRTNFYDSEILTYKALKKVLCE